MSSYYEKIQGLENLLWQANASQKVSKRYQAHFQFLKEHMEADDSKLVQTWKGMLQTFPPVTQNSCEGDRMLLATILGSYTFLWCYRDAYHTLELPKISPLLYRGFVQLLATYRPEEIAYILKNQSLQQLTELIRSEFFTKRIAVLNRLIRQMQREKNIHQSIARGEKAMETKLIFTKDDVDGALQLLQDSQEMSISEYCSKHRITLFRYYQMIRPLQTEHAKLYQTFCEAHPELLEIYRIQCVGQKLSSLINERHHQRRTISSYDLELMTNYSVCDFEKYKSYIAHYDYLARTFQGTSFHFAYRRTSVGVVKQFLLSDGSVFRKEITDEDYDRVMQHLEREGFYLNKQKEAYVGTYERALNAYLKGELDTIRKPVVLHHEKDEKGPYCYQ